MRKTNKLPCSSRSYYFKSNKGSKNYNGSSKKKKKKRRADRSYRVSTSTNTKPLSDT